jgi:hypothetical protein
MAIEVARKTSDFFVVNLLPDGGVQWHLGSRRPAVLGNVLGTVPPDMHGH